MESRALLAIVLLCVGFLQVHTYSTGAPKDACDSLTPQHGTDPQKDPFPYTIKSNVNKIRPSDKVRVTISSDSGTKFKGFILQARIGNVPYGTFEPSEDAQLIDCGTGQKNTATHTSSKDKSSVSLVWVAPPKLQGTIKFTATVAKNGGVFWVGKKSEPIRVIQ